MSASPERDPAVSAASAITRSGVLRGMRDMLPVALMIAPMAMAFGVAAEQQGVDAWIAVLMSFLLNAGASQFAALELWSPPLPVLLILTVTLAVNARHLVYGASLYPWLAPLHPLVRYSVLGVTNDASWAYAAQAQGRGATDAGLLLGASALLWVNWTLSTMAGIFFGTAIDDPRTYGLDVVMLAFFAASLVSLWSGPGDLKPWLAAAAGALLGLWLLPAGWYILVGAFAGGVVGALCDDG